MKALVLSMIFLSALTWEQRQRLLSVTAVASAACFVTDGFSTVLRHRYGFLALVLAAAVIFTIGGAFMKLSDGLTRPGPTAVLIACVVVGACLQALAMRSEEMAITYIVVLGLEAICAFLFGIFLFGEGISIMKFLGVTAICLGTIAMRQ